MEANVRRGDRAGLRGCWPGMTVTALLATAGVAGCYDGNDAAKTERQGAALTVADLAPARATSVAAAATLAAAAAPLEGGKRDFRRDPPRVAAVLARPAADGTSTMQVVFDDPQVLPDPMVLQPDGQRLVLKRDPEAKLPIRGQVFTAPLPIRFGDLAASEQRNADTLRRLKITKVPVFRGRQLVGVRDPLAVIDPDAINVVLGGIGALVDPARSLLVNDPGVVGDPTRTGTPCSGGNTSGTWSFKHLMEAMANTPVTGTPAGQLAERWLRHWDSNQVINGFNAPARPNINAILAAWPRDGAGDLDLAAAPFKLVAIVNRADLAGNVSYGSVGDAEGRFIFQLVDPNSCSPRPYLVIFEYLIPRHSCSELRDWAQQWMALGSLAVGSAAYNAALEAITEQFVAAGVSPTRPNGSAIRQVRTNEIVLTAPWELREFHLFPQFPTVPLLHQTSVANTPDPSANGTPQLAGWIMGAPFLSTSFGAAAPIPPSFWNAGGVDLERRHQFSLNTCNGCHSAETGTAFTHVTSSGLSGFLTGITISDPVSGVSRTFNDLQRRAEELEIMADSTCSPFPFVIPPLFEAPVLIHPLPPIEHLPIAQFD